jgi:hypothetical protein
MHVSRGPFRTVSDFRIPLPPESIQFGEGQEIYVATVRPLQNFISLSNGSHFSICVSVVRTELGHTLSGGESGANDRKQRSGRARACIF